MIVDLLVNIPLSKVISIESSFISKNFRFLAIEKSFFTNFITFDGKKNFDCFTKISMSSIAQQK